MEWMEYQEVAWVLSSSTSYRPAFGLYFSKVGNSVAATSNWNSRRIFIYALDKQCLGKAVNRLVVRITLTALPISIFARAYCLVSQRCGLRGRAYGPFDKVRHQFPSSRLTDCYSFWYHSSTLL